GSVVLSLGRPKRLHRHPRLVESLLRHCPLFGFHTVIHGPLQSLRVVDDDTNILREAEGLVDIVHSGTLTVTPSTLNTVLINADFPAPNWQLRVDAHRGHSWRRISV
ncbi:hypothetical protein B0H17DRAFT_1076972, partial [Mycena rosella]